MESDMLSLNGEDIEELRKLYNDALTHNKKQFEFKGKPVLTKFAKYLLEYIDLKMRDEGYVAG